MDKELINHLLFQMDVMKVGCEYDGIRDTVLNEYEYLLEAEKISEMLRSGAGISEAVVHAFDSRFQSASLPQAQREKHFKELARCLERCKLAAERRDITPRLKNNQINVENMTLLLWDADLMGTSCNFNLDMDDEYASEAKGIIRLLSEGMEFRPALEKVFDEWFGEGVLKTEGRQDDVNNLVRKFEVLQGVGC